MENDLKTSSEEQSERKRRLVRYSVLPFYENLLDILGHARQINPSIESNSFNAFCAYHLWQQMGKSDEKAAYFDINSLANYFKVHHHTIRTMIKQGELPATRVGKQYRIPATAVVLYTDIGRFAVHEKNNAFKQEVLQSGDLRFLLHISTEAELPILWRDFVRQQIGSPENPELNLLGMIGDGVF